MLPYARVPPATATIDNVSDLLADATAELYEADPDEFTARRAELAAAAREAGQPEAAKLITALRKPTRSAWLLNTLVRAHPEVPGRLAELAAELREGGDGARIRELTLARGRLVDELARQSFEALDADPPASVREDVVATLGAAIADPDVAAGLAAGTLVRAVRWAGFGEMPLTPGASSGAAPVRSPAPRTPPPPPKPKMTERELSHLTHIAELAAEAERDLEATVRGLETELEQARERLAQARRDSYRAEQRRKKAAEEFGRNGE